MTCCSRCSRSAKRRSHPVATRYVFLHFDSVVEFHPIDDLREALRTRAVVARCARRTGRACRSSQAFRRGSDIISCDRSEAHGGEARLDHVRAADADPMLGRKIVEREQRRVKFHLRQPLWPAHRAGHFSTGFTLQPFPLARGRCLTSICDTPERAGT